MSGTDCPDYPTIKALAVALGRPASTLYVLSETDPFYVTPGRQAAAAWFADVWRALNPPNGVQRNKRSNHRRPRREASREAAGARGA
jgi:hypothetical protein